MVELGDNISPAMTELDPSKILQVGLGFWGSKCLLSGVELGVFTELARKLAMVLGVRAEFIARRIEPALQNGQFPAPSINKGDRV